MTGVSRKESGTIALSLCLPVIGVYTGELSGMIAVVETEEFLTDVKGILSEDEHDDLILYVALHPEAGDVIRETGGLRKLRWAAKGRGQTPTFPCSLWRFSRRMFKLICRRGSGRP